MLDNLMNTFGNVQETLDAKRKKLDNITVNSEVKGGLIKATANANKIITDIKIDKKLLITAESEEIEDLLISLINKVLKEAGELSKTEMLKTANDMLKDFM